MEGFLYAKVHKKLIANIEEVIAGNNINEIEDINKEIALNQKELLIQVREKKDYTDVANEVDELKSEKHKMLVMNALDEDLKSRIADMEEYLSNQSKELTEYDEELVRKYIKQIKIYDDRFEVTFKSGVEVDIERI